MMRIVLGGVRGTSPVSHSDFLRYGGATTSLLVENGERAQIVIDAGTGLKALQPHFAAANANSPPLFLFTHYHLDHLIGLPAFAPLYDAGSHVTFASPLREGFSVENALNRLIEKPFWPASFRAQRRFLTLPEASVSAPLLHGPFEVRWCAVHHGNGCHAYRIDEPAAAASMVFATDLEWGASDEAEREALLCLCRTPHPADILIMDGQYDASESRRFSGWGHSTWQDAVQVADTAGVNRLVVTHHAPGNNDALLNSREQALRSLRKNACLAYDGMKIEIGGSI